MSHIYSLFTLVQKKQKAGIFYALFMLFSFNFFAQKVPQGFNYQAIARDLQGNELTDSLLHLRVSLLKGNTLVYSENHTQTTNAFGLFTLVIGQGTPNSVDSFASVPWVDGNIFLKIEVENKTGGFEQVGVPTQLFSVPYALYAGSGLPGADGRGITQIVKSNNNLIVHYSDGTFDTVFQIASQDSSNTNELIDSLHFNVNNRYLSVYEGGIKRDSVFIPANATVNHPNLSLFFDSLKITNGIGVNLGQILNPLRAQIYNDSVALAQYKMQDHDTSATNEKISSVSLNPNSNILTITEPNNSKTVDLSQLKDNLGNHLAATHLRMNDKNIVDFDSLKSIAGNMDIRPISPSVEGGDLFADSIFARKIIQSCPVGMSSVGFGSTLQNFCVDQALFPSVNGASYWDANRACMAVGKRLCDANELGYVISAGTNQVLDPIIPNLGLNVEWTGTIVDSSKAIAISATSITPNLHSTDLSVIKFFRCCYTR